jgi:addiction module RelE/StbE family toxin
MSEADCGQLEVFTYGGSVRYCLLELWEERGPLESPPASSEHRSFESEDSDVMFSLREPEPSEWSLAFTPTFKKAIAAADRKLQGRILGAVSELSSEPLMPHGDTIKPLTGEFKGLWRYRVGDYRLIYRPTAEGKCVVLLDFAPRGAAYD